MPIMGNYRKLYGRFKFVVYVEGFLSAAFQKATGLKITVSEMKYHEGGALVPYKEPGLVEFSDLTLERGVSKEIDFWSWVLQVVNIMAKMPGGIGVPSPGFMRNLTIRQMDRDDSPAIDWKLYWGFPKDFTPGEFDNTSSEVTLETLVVAYHHFERVQIAA